MSNLDIFNLDAESLVTPVKKEGSKDLEFYKPYPEDGKDGVYKSLVRFVPNSSEPTKSKIHKYYVYLKDPSTGNGFSVDCPSTVGKKSVLKDIFWKLQNSNSAADKELSKNFSRKEDYYSLIQIVQDKNRPELEGKIMIFKFGKKLNDMIEAQLKPEYGEPVNPFDLFNGKLFSIHARKVGEWNNYDLCQFVGDKMAIIVDGSSVEKTEEGREIVTKYLKTGPLDLDKYDYNDWSDAESEKIMRIIRNTIPDGRMVSEIIGSSADSKTSSAPTSVDDFYEQANSRTATASEDSEDEAPAKPSKTPTKKSAPSLDDLYNDL